MRLVIHDYSGHPFQLQLSRSLAHRGHQVMHQFCSSYVTGKGALTRHDTDPETFSVEDFAMGEEFARYSPAKRISQELRFGRRLAKRTVAIAPDVAVMCNIPLLAHSVAARRVKAARVPMVFWHQDVYSGAIAAAAIDKFGVAGRPVGRLADRLERRIARASDAVVPISPVFEPVLRRWGVSQDRITTIPNWGALDEITVRPRDNNWARLHGLADVPVVLYSGTLGLKHDPSVLLDIADALEGDQSGARMVVVSQGRGRDWLEERQRERRRSSLLLLDFQDYADLPDVLGSADLLLAVLEKDASQFSVPSKVLSYLCAGRPILGIMPADNGAAETIQHSGAGLVVDPSRQADVVSAVRALLADRDRRLQASRAARTYAEQAFPVDVITDRFEHVLERVNIGQSTAGRSRRA